MEGKELPLVDPGEVGSGLEDVGLILRHGFSGNTAPRVRDLGGDPPHGADPGEVPPLGGTSNNWETPEATDGWGMGVIPGNRGAQGFRSQGVVGIHKTEAEHGVTFHLHLSHHGSMPGSREASGGQGRENVVGAERPEICRRAGAGTGK